MAKDNKLVELQRQLINWGYLAPKLKSGRGADDGFMGPKTLEAIRKAQAEGKLDKQNKIVDKDSQSFGVFGVSGLPFSYSTPFNLEGPNKGLANPTFVSKMTPKLGDLDHLPETKPYTALDYIKSVNPFKDRNEAIPVQQGLIELGYLPKTNKKGRTNADGYFYYDSQTAYEKAQRDGYKWDGKAFTKDEKSKLLPKKEKSNSFSFGNVAEPYGMAAQSLVSRELSQEDPSELTLAVSNIFAAPRLAFRHKQQALNNGVDKVKTEWTKGNYGRALYSLLGTGLDVATSTPENALLQRVAPMYGMGLKDVPVAIYNKWGHMLFDNPNYSAIKGQTYNNDDFSPKFNRLAAEALGRGGDQITPILRRDVDPNMTYGDTKAILHVFNPTANYAMSVGQVSPKRDKLGNYYTDDPYDNSTASNNYYLSSLRPTDIIRGLAGSLTSNEDTDPLEGKQKYQFKFTPEEVQHAVQYNRTKK